MAARYAGKGKADLGKAGEKAQADLAKGEAECMAPETPSWKGDLKRGWTCLTKPGKASAVGKRTPEDALDEAT